MLCTIAEAAKATGLEESIIFRAIENGQIHGTRNVSGEWHVEDAELHSARIRGSRRRFQQLRCFTEELDRKVDLAGNLRLRVFLRRHKDESLKA